MKRFRDKNGKLSMCIDQVAAATLDEANAYYIDGETYILDDKIAICKRWHENDADHIRFDFIAGGSVFCIPDRMGTFLPDVASDGLTIIKAAKV